MVVPQVNDSTTTSVNGSVAATETTTNTEASSTAGETATQEVQAPPKPVSAPPKVNPWKMRAGQSSARPVHAPEPVPADDSSTNTSDKVVSITQEVNGLLANDATAPQQKRPIRAAKADSQVIDDATLWPTLDKALGESAENGHRKQSTGEGNETSAPSAPKVNGKEKWTKYTPTIMYTPIPSKAVRGGGSNMKGTGRGSAVPRSGRDKPDSDKSELTADGKPKSSRSSDTSRPRTTKSRSLSVSNSRSERPSRRESQSGREGESVADGRSHSSKRSDRGSISAPNGSTPTSEASKSPQMGANGSAQPELAGAISGGEQRPHRASYDAAFAARARGTYRGTRGGYQGNYNGRYQNPAFAAQPHMQAGRGYTREQIGYGFDQYQNFVNPAIAPVMIDPMVARHMVLNQCEYYFSIENLCKDLFLRKHMDGEGFVNLPILAKFNRVRAITLDYALIRDVCVMSSKIELRAASGAYDKIRRAEGWEQWVLPEDQRDDSTRDVPEAVTEIPISRVEDAHGEETRDMSSSIGAPAFVPGQTNDVSAPATSTLTENFANLGLGRKLSPDVKEFKSANPQVSEAENSENTDPTAM